MNKPKVVSILRSSIGDMDEPNFAISSTGPKTKAPIITPIVRDCSGLALDLLPAIHPPMNGPRGPDMKCISGGTVHRIATMKPISAFLNTTKRSP